MQNKTFRGSQKQLGGFGRLFQALFVAYFISISVCSAAASLQSEAVNKALDHAVNTDTYPEAKIAVQNGSIIILMKKNDASKEKHN